MDISRSNILITGGGGAFGRAFSLELASRGAGVLACDVNDEGLDLLKEEADKRGLTVETARADVTREQEVESLFQTFTERGQRLDVLINNAGIAADGLLVKKEGDRIEKFPLSGWQRGLDVNLTGVFLCAREAACHMIRHGKGGLILNLSSISRHGNFIQSNYSATKAGVAALSVVWAKELSRHGIRVVALAPGYIDTPLTRKIRSEVLDRITGQIPSGRLGRIEEVTQAVVFAIQNDYLNGRVIDLDGGLRV